ncbi:MAG: CoA transferase [Candidatus Rokubacteria bacterium]|nr:CoA transferase [Candidatus Rokubacteria bacterium]MBI2555147.1 CoA transferase [Candidatus Rokubacteria bacterium]
METAWPDWARERDHPSQAFAKPEALDDLLVLDCSHASFAGLVAGSFLAELGAEVIRVEPPGGDPARHFTPFGLLHRDTGLGYLIEGRNKFHITLNLDVSEGRQLLNSLAATADVLIETFLPGQMDAWGLGYRQLAAANPRLIYCALYTYGQFGPRAGCGQPNADIADQALSGVTFISGFLPEGPAADPTAVPTRQGSWHGWTLGGFWGAFGILAALSARSTLGVGQFVDVSPAEALMRSTDGACAWWELDGVLRSRVGNYDTAIFPYAYFRSKDGYVLLAAVMDLAWKALAGLMGRPDLYRQYPTIPSRKSLEVQARLHKELEAWTATLTFEELAAKAEAANRGIEQGVIVVGRVVDLPEVVKNAHYRERATLSVFTDPTYGDLLIQFPFQKMSASPPRLKWTCRAPGQDNAHVYAKHLGLGRESLADLRTRGIV